MKNSENFCIYQLGTWGDHWQLTLFIHIEIINNKSVILLRVLIATTQKKSSV